MESLLKLRRGIFVEDSYTERDKWMNGRKSRRSCGRDNGREFDWCVIRGVDVAPNYFRGKAPQQISIEACRSDS